MADINALLKAGEKKLKKLGQTEPQVFNEELQIPQKRKTIERKGATRPWQENLPQYQIFETNAETGSNQAVVQVETEDKVETNRGQSGDKLETISRTKWRQTEDKVETSKAHFVETEDKLETKLRTQLRTKWRQTEDKVETNPSIYSLVGLQKRLLFFFYESCQRNRSHLTEKLPATSIASAVNSTIFSVKKSIQRLEQRHLIHRHAFKNGRSGWTIFELPDLVFRELLQIATGDKLETNWRQTGDKLETKLGTEPRTTPPCSSSSIPVSNKTTTTELDSPSISINIPELLSHRVSEAQLRQLVESDRISLTDLEESLEAFAYDLANGKLSSKIGNPIGALLSTLQKGSRWYSPGYRNEIDKLIAENQARIEKAQQAHQALQESQDELLFLEFLSNHPEKAESLKPAMLTRFEPGSGGYIAWRRAVLDFMRSSEIDSKASEERVNRGA